MVVLAVFVFFLFQKAKEPKKKIMSETEDTELQQRRTTNWPRISDQLKDRSVGKKKQLKTHNTGRIRDGNASTSWEQKSEFGYNQDGRKASNLKIQQGLLKTFQ